MLFKYIVHIMCLAIMAPERQFICVKEWRKSTNTFGLKCAYVIENKISCSLIILKLILIRGIRIFKGDLAYFAVPCTFIGHTERRKTKKEDSSYNV